jgi:hypothetical protein
MFTTLYVVMKRLYLHLRLMELIFSHLYFP